MERDFDIPQGHYQIGRDIPGGVYLIGALNKFTIIHIATPNGNRAIYSLSKDNTMIVHVELEKDFSLNIDGRVTMRRITKFMEGDKCNLLDELASFENDLKARGVKLATKKYEHTK